ncbi:(deoxy)nucleoside triphosphate pyrophosphohydrolase [Cytophaga hutchinsonii]|jgi:8-oxo-dGTP diphosphatase|uniref:8-oxo-dGTP diphosphatase n=1 Tax=Cytophaga hutchinsonii (strain ATCC 33406 / DSM 1761 / CIP 103989 / NBRC 15051 / NCIMB 9469 / D465) TaxID=269798 RepID=A0A6N4SVS5_CYTH3|nr:(deoxy)nucleoside triphosphate pyrophosphohydrolase [Cytophaga hutchinsonii]ABG60339.1 mutator protein; oxidative damage repair protein [Cytophaga hutchinsonii ATCC 33406]SFX98712.1 8-oxo-dGTP diphosphatase [Cytophaga hutchinsonii ATCC 33406]
MTDLPTIAVVCAVIKQQDSYFIAQRSAKMKMPLKWEFPGGKVEKGETNAQAIMREMKEEFDVNVEVIQEHPFYLHQYPNFILQLSPMEVEITSGKLTLKEHANYRWVAVKDLFTYDFSEGDVNIVKALNKRDKALNQ